MKKLILPFIFILLSITFTTNAAAAGIQGQSCATNKDCNTGLECKDTTIDPNDPSTKGRFCVKSEVSDVIGSIKPPEAVAKLGFGAEGLSNFFNTAIQLIYIVAGLLFVFMVIISALQWITSGGDKEAVAGARNRLTFAIIGIVVLALAFVIIRVLGQITGFEFFVGQNP